MRVINSSLKEFAGAIRYFKAARRRRRRRPSFARRERANPPPSPPPTPRSHSPLTRRRCNFRALFYLRARACAYKVGLKYSFTFSSTFDARGRCRPSLSRGENSREFEKSCQMKRRSCRRELRECR